MRVVAPYVFALASIPWIAPLTSLSSGCGGAVTSSSSDASSDGSILPVEDGAVCGCASPDCLPNCIDLPACKVECTSETNGVGDGGDLLVWLDPCGKIQFTQPCPNGCTEASPAKCQ